MSKVVYRYRFSTELTIGDIEDAIVRAIEATKSLHGDSQVRLDAGHFLDTKQRQCVIDAGTDVGRDLNRMFVGLISNDFGPDCFMVERLDSPPPEKSST